MPRRPCVLWAWSWACRSPCRTVRPGRSHDRSKGRRSLAEVLHWAQKLWPANQFGKLTGRKDRCYLARPVRSVCVMLVSVVTGCAVPRSGTAPVAGAARPSPAAPARDSLQIAVVYPAVTDVIQSHDSAFLFGAVRGGGGAPVHLAEGIPLSVQATPGATVRLLLPWGSSIPLVPDTAPVGLPGGVRAFVIDTTPRRHTPVAGRYVGWLPAAALCADGRTACATLAVGVGGDTATARWPLSVNVVDMTFPTVIVLDDDTARTGTTDGLSPGRTVPHGTYNWFFPTGTVAVESGRWNDQVRLRLSRATVAWVNEADVVRLPPGTPPPGGVVSSVRLASGPKSVTLRVPLPARLPFQITERERSLTLRLYGGASDINWMQYGEGGGAAGTDPLVTRMTYAQPAADEVTITLELARSVWGYRARFDGGDLLLEVRRPPAFDREHRVRGRTIVLDPGHPPLRARGPTGLWEPVATLAVAFRAKTLLERAGAVVFLTRTDSTPIELYPRTHFAELHDADVLVSIHANALPDGVNPFTNSGTSVYYFQPRSTRLARELDRALVAELRVRDLGSGRGDYALVRPTWMPAALTEGLFVMLPEQEALLASEDGQWRYARAVVRGIENFLRERAREP